MKITVDWQALADPVAATARAINQRPTHPALGGMLVEADGDLVRVAAFDYDVSVRADLAAAVAEPGRILLPGRVLAQVVASLKAGQVEIMASGAEAQIRCGPAEFSLPTMPVDDYPTLPEPPATLGTIDGALLATAIKQVGVACSADDALAMLTGIRVDAAGAAITLAATDRYRIAVRDLEWDAGADVAAGILLSGRTLHEVGRHLGPGPAEIGWSDRIASITHVGRLTTMRLLDPTFPAYRERAAAIQPSTTARVPVAAMVEAVKRVALVAERNTAVRLAFTADHVTVRAGGGDLGRGAETVPCEVGGDDLEIAFHPQFLADGLAGVAGEWATIGLQAPMMAALIGGEDPSYSYVIQPLRLS